MIFGRKRKGSGTLEDNLAEWREIREGKRAVVDPDEGQEKEGQCFVVTAVYGSPLAQEVNTMRIFRDEFLEDYLRQLVFIIHPESLIKDEPCRLNIMMIRTHTPECFVFDNGTIVITTGQIARTNTEKELIGSCSIAHRDLGKRSRFCKFLRHPKALMLITLLKSEQVTTSKTCSRM